VSALPPAAPVPAGRRPLLVLLGLAVAVQLVVLYFPEGGGPLLFPQADKVVHVVVFLVPVALAVLAGLPRRAVVAVFGAQAVLSEVVQWLFLPRRSGDAWDAVADLTGVALGVLIGTALLRRRARPTANVGQVRRLDDGNHPRS
jgi:hypothetical protein